MYQFASAIIVAAGNSTRMGGKSKIFIEINDTPAIVHTLKTFEQAELINEIIIVCKDEDRIKIKELISKHSINKFKAFAQGGATRQESVFSGIKQCSEQASHFVIHDAARCLISVEEINAVTKDAFTHKASTLGVPCKDTIKIINFENFVSKTPSRDSLWTVQTPQVFEKNLYLNAMDVAIKNGKNYTDDCQLIENISIPVHIVKGQYTNQKLTTPDDIILFTQILKEKECK